MQGNATLPRIRSSNPFLDSITYFGSRRMKKLGNGMSKYRITAIITHLMEARMTLQNRPDVHAPAYLTEEQCQRVADALESAQSENTHRNYAGQFPRFSAWYERENYLPVDGIS